MNNEREGVAMHSTLAQARCEVGDGKTNGLYRIPFIPESMPNEKHAHVGVIARGTYNCSVPLIRKSRLTTLELGGIGKNLSEGWCLNFAVGCTHGCPFCYVDSIHKRFGKHRYGSIVLKKWGDYLLVPENFKEAVDETPWERWKGAEVMLSSTHDPYIPELKGMAHAILAKALPKGVRFCIQTRSTRVLDDLTILAEYRNQVRLQISLATSDEEFARKIEPRVPSPASRLRILREAKDSGIRIGVIVAPVFPPLTARPDVRRDMKEIASMLSDVKPDYIFGESLHVRGGNYRLLEEILQEPIRSKDDFDEVVSSVYRGELKRRGLDATWWPDSRHIHSAYRRNSGPLDGTGFLVRANGGNGICREQRRTTGNGLRGISQT